jgi:Tfp pilus assembly protein PilV
MRPLWLASGEYQFDLSFGISYFPPSLNQTQQSDADVRLLLMSQLSIFNHRQRSRRALRSAAKKRGGFAILENAVAASILALVVVGILTITSHSFIVMQQTRDFSRANQILQQKMEDIRLLRFSDIQSLPATFTDPSDSQNKFAGAIAKETYRTSLSGAPVSIKVTLSVTWTGRDGKPRTQTMTSVFSSTGLNDYIF